MYSPHSVQQKVTEITYNNSPLLRPPTVKDYEQADPAWMKQFIKKSFSDPSAFMWNFTGDFKNRMDEMIPLLEKYIGCIPIPKSREYQGRVRSARCKETIELVSKAVSFPPGVQTGVRSPIWFTIVSFPTQNSVLHRLFIMEMIHKQSLKLAFHASHTTRTWKVQFWKCLNMYWKLSCTASFDMR
jgi:hypothetical protein